MEAATPFAPATIEPTRTTASDPYRDYVDPEELAGPILADPLPFDVQILAEFYEGGVKCTELQFLSEVHEGQKIYMHGWLCYPAQPGANGSQPAQRFPALLSIPGGVGISQKNFPIWVARKCGVIVLGVDWIGSGKSSKISGFDPWENAMRFEGHDYRNSYQYHNVRGLLRATKFLLSQPQADPDLLMAAGGSWGGFYSWLLGGLDERFKYIFPTFGCGFLNTECSQVWESFFTSMGNEKAETWLRAFDPGRRAHLIKAEVFFQQATNDKFYSLLASMKTYHRVRTKKSLLLIRNQDHFIEPYLAQDVKRIQHLIKPDSIAAPPVLHGTEWIAGTNTVEVQGENLERLDLAVNYSCGSFTKSFGRYWRSAPVTQVDGRWLAEIPVVDVNREIWFYGHADQRDDGLAVSTPVVRLIPADMGLEQPTAEFDPSFDFASGEFWHLPVGGRQHPLLRLVTEDGITGIEMKFTGPESRSESRRGVAYCLEGDLIARYGYNAIEVLVKVPEPSDLKGLKLVLVTDFHGLSEQNYAVELDTLGLDFSAYQTLRIPFADFKPIQHRHYWFYQPPLAPMNVARLCGVGFFHGDLDYSGRALLAQILARRIEGAPEVPTPPRLELSWPPREAVLNEPDPRAVPGQG